MGIGSGMDGNSIDQAGGYQEKESTERKHNLNIFRGTRRILPKVYTCRIIRSIDPFI